ncbi:TonB-dependent receptor [Mucilaginibacter sp. L3T2-6]|uniref:SusC/RagA family TonB-linked outer membrane protein n=1 Tax=Mucilaginibacter sp. L3T2-6 TaxID=3062491 RepID=UPI0026755C36|nr:TonB-dependent receptor [Mucilaginibacter sp. L3T2-6]MDO3645209.1 TonB-dependent receptor [Mucilaginibacter sp. L3T2-6]MDV6217658.1 TonB-dependent receptor [Mucilaginibacter sp. L3T2-6]
MIKKLQIKNVVAIIGLSLSLLVMSLSGYAQSGKVTGTVTDGSNGAALPGVTVKVKGTQSASITDINGGYSINAPANATLVFSYIGFITYEAAVNGNSVVNAKLAPDTRSLSEVVVVGYGTSTRKDLTGSVSSVSAATIAKVPVTSLEQALQGRAAGVQVTNNDGAPGANVSVLIRGIGSLASYGNGPLYVVDGYATSGGISNINPSDIESIDVLKDASATAIYGVRAANGVVIVTTKKGKKDGVQVDVTAYTAFQSRPKEYKLLNAQQFATLANEVAAGSNGNFQTFDAWKDPASLTTVDWQNAMYRTGITQNYSIGLRGGGEKVQSATSISYYDQKGIVLGSYFKRVTLGNNSDYQPTKWLKSSTSAKYSYQDSNNPFGTGSLVQLSELPPTLDGGNKFTNLPSDGKGNYGFYNPIYTYVAKYSNPVYTVSNDRYQNITNYLLANTSLEAQIISGLKIKTFVGINLTTFTGSFFQPEDDRLVQQYGSQAGATQNAFYNQHINQTFEWLWENTISYNKTFGKHSIDFVGGVSEQKNTWNGMGGSGIPPNSIIRDLSQVTNLQLDANNPVGSNTGNGQNIYSFESQFARLTYKYGDKYLLTGTVRRDGSSKFDEGHQYGVFPSGAVAWRAKQEDFLKDVSWIDDLKFRGSYGEVGNQGSINPFQYDALYSTGLPAASSGNLGYPFNKIYQKGTASTQPPNPDLKWETDYITDIGADLAFIHGDLTITADWFNRKSKDFLLLLAAPAQSGYNYITRNVGSMQNKGFEFAANYNHTINSDLKYGIGLNFTTVNNKLTSITSGTDFVTNFGGLSVQGIGWSTFTETHVGQPVGEFYGYKSLGIFQSQAQIDALNAAAVAKGKQYYQRAVTAPGDRYFADVNGDGSVDATDQTSLGSPLPKFYGGLNLDLTYKAFDFNAYFYGVYGNKIFDYQESALESFQNRGFVGVENVSVEYYQNRWTPGNPSNTYARATSNDDATGNNVPSSAWIQNGSFLKLKNFTVGYTLPSDIAKSLYLNKLRLYFSTQNLFTITGYKGLDPEIGIQGGNATQNGIDNGTYPSSKFYTIGINVTLK